MRTRNALVPMLALAATLALTGCSSDASPTNSPTTAAGSPVAGSWGKEATGQPSITIAEDGAFNGTDGCNSMAGHGTLADGKFDLGAFRTTLMACEGIDTWLSKAASATRSGDTLTLFDKDGTQIGTLDKR
ncbi:MAG: META domain-containing protein [Intrasporangium sp.]|uniref:META domain-containing protein n=1 Tax=Intrasporangium sp. TaxID=1925024 RepID=UPI0026481934|nr:META domain-containing protein [Intrasporangium sp.]MDN5794602.1 META domain-containing protein [Intrasporangium sp.]